MERSGTAIHRQQPRDQQNFRPDRADTQSGRILDEIGTPYRIRTGVTAVRGRRPEPLDEGSGVSQRN